MIPRDRITKEHVVAALAEIDRTEVPAARRAKGYDLVFNGKSYPPKYALSLAGRYATGEELHGFPGGEFTNSILREMGFQITAREHQGMRDALEHIMSAYVDARTREAFGKEHVIWKRFEELQHALEEISAIAQQPTLRVKFSVGKGNWTNIPWVALLDTRETDTTQHGVYPVFLFRQDMSGVYFTLAQGVTEPIKKLGARGARDFLHQNAAQIRHNLAPLQERGFSLDGMIELQADYQAVGADYTDSTIAYKFYAKGEVPDDDSIEADVEAVLGAYNQYLAEKTTGEPETPYWLFQASPQYYDITGALKALDTQTWLVSQYKKEIKAGHRAYVWEAGPNAGLVASAVVECDPIEMETKADKAPFIREQGKFAGPQLRVILRFDRRFDPRILRKNLVEDPILRDLSVIKFPQATNFAVTAAQAKRIEELTGGSSMPNPESLLQQLSQQVHLPEEQLLDIKALLQDKKQLILEGPPGSGKTFVAQKFARYFAGVPLEGATDSQVRIVQFHQSYSYEDFVEGIRPDTQQGQIAYKVTPGIFKRLCNEARSNPNRRYVLIIDEINRGNLSRIFGELLMLLEYRNLEIELPYQEAKFRIPDNVFLIGTMNTTDRSLAQVDYALRRRFYFYQLRPMTAGTAPVLSRWLEATGVSANDQATVLSLFVALNARVTQELGEHFQIGHSYFMRPEITSANGRQQIWEHAILPLLEEYFYNRRERKKLLADFAIDKLLAQASSAATA